jgi:hypothetical protein
VDHGLNWNNSGSHHRRDICGTLFEGQRPQGCKEEASSLKVQLICLYRCFTISKDHTSKQALGILPNYCRQGRIQKIRIQSSIPPFSQLTRKAKVLQKPPRIPLGLPFRNSPLSLPQSSTSYRYRVRTLKCLRSDISEGRIEALKAIFTKHRYPYSTLAIHIAAVTLTLFTLTPYHLFILEENAGSGI